MLSRAAAKTIPELLHSSKSLFLPCSRLVFRSGQFSRVIRAAPIRSFSIGKLGSKYERDPRFAVLEQKDRDFFKSILPPEAVIEDKDDLEAFNEDWMKKYNGQSKICLKPRTTEQVSKIMAYCNEHRLAVCPQGGNTGLVGGSVPLFDEIIVNLSAMTKIVSFDEVSGVLVCQAGCVLQALDEQVNKSGFMMPVDMAAKGSCHIGGNVATNAGGLRYLRYGSMHGNVLGLEVVLADGTVLDTLSTLRKDNTGYDMKQLFIGSEGTLGIVTAVAINTPRKPKSINVSFFACDSYEDVTKMFTYAMRELGEIVSAVEFMDRGAMEVVLKHLEGARDPLEAPHPFYVLIETSGSNVDHDQEKMTSFLEKVLTDEVAVDGVLAQDNAQARQLWHVREGIAEACARVGAVYMYDLSIPLQQLYDVVIGSNERLRDEAAAKAIGFGHLGDCNLHLVVYNNKYDEELVAKMEPWVYEWTARHKGSVGAEHGVGRMKADCVHFRQPEAVTRSMFALKSQMDPNGILNPYKVLPSKILPKFE